MFCMNENELYHHGIKGQKWGVRRYQYSDGSLTPAGKKRYGDSSKSPYKKAAKRLSLRVTEIQNNIKTQITGRQYADTIIKKGTSFQRIQTSDAFEKFAFYATYKKRDSEKYMGLFGKNLTSRAFTEAKIAEKEANKTGNELDITKAKDLKEKAKNMKVYQLKIKAVNKLKVPSDENVSHITVNLMKDSEFKNNLIFSIKDSKQKMRRPEQQLLFSHAEHALKKDISRLTTKEKIAIYKAFNLSLVNHSPQEVAAQNKFYSELKKKGYNAILDYNDKEFSSYHAKRPMIVFDLDSVKLDSVSETNPKVIASLNRKFNRERIVKEIGANTIGLVKQVSSVTVSQCNSYVKDKTRLYLS